MRAITSIVYVVDVEATCWETSEERGDRPNEIIEIGICKLNLRTAQVSDVSSYLVKPKFTEVSPFCTELTGWRPEDLVDAASMAETLRAIRADYALDRDNLWFSFGEYDRVKLSSIPGEKGGVLDLYGIDRHSNPFAQMKHFNVKTLMMLREHLDKGLGMNRALKYYGLTLDGRHHNGADDAANIAKIVLKVLAK